MPDETTPKDIDDLIAVMEALRNPETGCPWDIEQTFETIAPYTIEEAYEVADAIERGNTADLREELGDLLLQVVYHARIGEEHNQFSFADIADGITRKMIRRHPHVFGTPRERAAGPSKGFWERIKAEERAEKQRVQHQNGITAPANVPSALDGVPSNMPALVRAIKLQKKAAKVGFDWPSLGPVLEKMREELAELDEAFANNNQGAVREELGDLLFSVVNVARHLGLDPEDALRQTNAKFENRFHGIEDQLRRLEKPITKATLEEMDALWDKAKAEQKLTSKKPTN